MKQFYSIFALLLITVVSNAQVADFEYGLKYIGVNSTTGYYQLAVTIKPTENVVNGEVRDFGSGLFHPTGTTLDNFQNGDFNFSLNELSNSEPTGNDPTNSDPGAYLNRIPNASNPDVFLNLTSGTVYNLFLFDVNPGSGNPNPSSGSVRFVENTSPATFGYLEQFFNINLTEDASPTASDYFIGNDPAADNIQFSTLSTVSNELDAIKIYPNPVKNILNIKGLNNQLNKVSIYNVTGQIVLSQKTNLSQINTSSLSPGVYFLNLETQTASKTIKLVKK
jgi:hypothetical protein